MIHGVRLANTSHLHTHFLEVGAKVAEVIHSLRVEQIRTRSTISTSRFCLESESANRFSHQTGGILVALPLHVEAELRAMREARVLDDMRGNRLSADRGVIRPLHAPGEAPQKGRGSSAAAHAHGTRRRTRARAWLAA